MDNVFLKIKDISENKISSPLKKNKYMCTGIMKIKKCGMKLVTVVIEVCGLNVIAF